MSQQEVVLLLGTNLGNKVQNLNDAKERIKNEIGTILTESEILETKPVEFVSSNNFFNFALLINTQFSPINLLKSIKKIEKDLGRIEDTLSTGTYSDRIIDVDIVSYNNINFKCNVLEIPHIKHLYEREFSMSILSNLKKIKHK